MALITLLAASCSGINKAKDIITNPTAKEIYSREFKEAQDLFALWKNEAADALFDSVAVNLPYAEKGIFSPRTFSVYSYEVALNPGEKLKVEVDTDSSETLIFIDFYR